MSEPFLVREGCALCGRGNSGSLIGSKGQLSPGVPQGSERKAGAHLDQFHGVCTQEEGILDREALDCLVGHVQLGVHGIHPV